jgi:hypothetical protein
MWVKNIVDHINFDFEIKLMLTSVRARVSRHHLSTPSPLSLWFTLCPHTSLTSIHLLVSLLLHSLLFYASLLHLLSSPYFNIFESSFLYDGGTKGSKKKSAGSTLSARHEVMNWIEFSSALTYSFGALAHDLKFEILNCSNTII